MMMMPQHGAEAAGGYNFQRVMEDHFEHYKRPPSLNPIKTYFFVADEKTPKLGAFVHGKIFKDQLMFLSKDGAYIFQVLLKG
jgi:hypothetical protein